jgi:putative membrane protein
MLAGSGVAQSQTMPNAAARQQAMPNAGQQLSKQDQNFVKDAAIGGMAEVELGKLAQQNSQDEQVKQFGARMVQDHGSANNELTTIANEKGVALPQQLDPKHQQLADRLGRLHGTAFDRAYMAEMVKDHNEDMRAFQREAQAGKDPDIKQFAAKTLSVIGEHDKLAKDVDRSLTATGSSRAPR